MKRFMVITRNKGIRYFSAPDREAAIKQAGVHGIKRRDIKHVIHSQPIKVEVR